ncbi:hypothetical protein LBMAG42_49420 [Deltaproteobacteria bacterium]|nr:hypothetical protein LBMAG42_49420 [Deltaproteobacteria bacterium]
MSPAAPQPPTSKPWWAWRHPLFGRPPLLHPFLAPLPSLLSYTHDNHGMATWRLALFPLALTWLATIPLLLLLSGLSRNPRTAAVATTLIVVAFHAHGDAGKHAPWMWGIVSVATLGLILYRGAGDALTIFANLLLGIGVLPTLWTTIADDRADPAPHVRPGYLTSLDLAATVPPPNRATLPDIWYFVLDGYGREDVLESDFGVTNSGLADDLRARGFYVATGARSNYAQTALSIASSFNMAPLPELLDDLAVDSENRLPLQRLIADNRLTRRLRQAGYRIVQYPGEYSMTRLADADENRGAWFTFNEYDYVLLGHTPILTVASALGFPQQRLSHAVRRHAIETVLDDLPQGDRDPGPTFVYVHIVAPHPPFVFAEDGRYRRSRSRMFFGDGSTWWKYAKKYKESYEEGYRAQLTYISRRMTEAVDGILATSDRPPVILIQGDHGPGSHLVWAEPDQTDMHERMGILSAYLVPDPSALWPTITPVNSFRVVLNQVLGTEIPRAEDRSWFSGFSTPYDLRDETARLAAGGRPIAAEAAEAEGEEGP